MWFSFSLKALKIKSYNNINNRGIPYPHNKTNTKHPKVGSAAASKYYY